MSHNTLHPYTRLMNSAETGRSLVCHHVTLSQRDCADREMRPFRTTWAALAPDQSCRRLRRYLPKTLPRNDARCVRRGLGHPNGPLNGSESG